MKELLIKFLKTLEEVVPPPVECHHAITYAQYGSDEIGWEDRLALRINVAGDERVLFLDTGDLENEIDWDLVKTLVKKANK